MTSYTVKTPQQLGAVQQCWRKTRELTQAQVGARLGLAQTEISNWRLTRPILRWHVSSKFWRRWGWIDLTSCWFMRLPQEDLCQATGTHATLSVCYTRI